MLAPLITKREIEMENVTINGVEYTPVVKNSENRAVIVVDRGWIFAGDVERRDGRIYLTNAVWLFCWESVGFDGVIANPKSDKVTIKPMPNGIDIPEGSEIFCVPVKDGWGL